MENRNVIILRSASGAGKTTFANFLVGLKSDAVVCSADDHFYKNGVYTFNPAELGFAHNSCRNKFTEAVLDGKELIVVSNTNSTEKEFSFYKEVAEKHGYQVFFLVVEKRHDNKNSHNCPDEAIQRQANNIKSSLSLY